MDINKGEFTDALWLNPKEALDMYYRDELPLLVPQYLCLCHFTLIDKIEDFKSMSKSIFDSNLISYSSIAATIKNLSKLPKSMRLKAVA